MIISFAWTTKAFLAGKKTVTRRTWDDDYALRFKVGSRHQAWSASPRRGGKQVGEIEILSIRREPLTLVIEKYEYGLLEIAREGGLWATPEEFVDAIAANLKRPAHEIDVWRIEFKAILPGGTPCRTSRSARSTGR